MKAKKNQCRCGSVNTHVRFKGYVYEGKPGDWRERSLFQVVCVACNSFGPLALNHNDAVFLWKEQQG